MLTRLKYRVSIILAATLTSVTQTPEQIRTPSVDRLNFNHIL